LSQFTAYCPTCQARYTLDERFFGKTLLCQHCMTNFAIDAPEPADAAPLVPTHYPAQQSLSTGHAPEVVAGYAVSRPFSGFDRAMIFLGVCLIGIGLILNLLPLFNWQVPLFVARGQLGQYIGFGMGLFGAFTLMLGLRRSLLMAGASGAGAAAICSAVFGVSMYLKGDPDKSMVRSGNNRGNSNASLSDIPLQNLEAPWAKAWPEWKGFSSTGYSWSPAADWSRQVSDIQGISVSMPGDSQGDTRQVKVGGRNTEVSFSESSYQDMTFRISTFKYPFEKRSDEEKFKEVQKAILEGDPVLEETTVGRFAAREFTINDDSKSQHGLMVAVGDMIVVLHAEGDKASIPGEASRKLINSLHISPTIAADRSRDAQDALDPFVLDSRGGSRTSPVRETRSPASSTEVRLNRENAGRDKALQQKITELVASLETGIAEKASTFFPSEYLSMSVGYDSGEPVFLASPDKKPVLGIDMVFQTDNGSTAFTGILPVFDEKQDCVVKARSGYALSGIRVNSSERILGLQFAFSKITGEGFDVSDTYESDWYGDRPDGASHFVESGNRPVYGIWVMRNDSCNAIGLIRETK
jgi:hypothetical protein